MRSDTDLPPPAPPAATDPLLEAARRGESAAFQTLFERISRPLRAFAATRGAGDPDGLVNEALAEAFRGLPTFVGGEDAFRGFVFHIARRRLVDEYRRSSRRVRTVPITERIDAISPADPAREVTSRDRAVRLVSALTEDQRDVILLRVVADLSIEETAAALGKPITAIKALQRRALGTLRRKIAEGAVS
ncbi:MAG: RNA polymerase sigma factor [Actinomycetota bacterium]